jgi:small subunit ribosomal protein S6
VRSYELTYIVHPEVDGDDLTAVGERINALVERDGGKIVQTESWGLRRLAYPVQKQWEGQYVLMRLELEPQSVSALERGLGLIEPIMRHLIVRIEGEETGLAEPTAE